MPAEHIPTDESRRVVEVMVACGNTEDDIAIAIGIAPKTLRRHYGAEIKAGKAKCHGKVQECLFRMAISGNHPAATFFYLKTQCGWRETSNVDITSDGKGLVPVTVYIPDNGRDTAN